MFYIYGCKSKGSEDMLVLVADWFLYKLCDKQ